VILSSAGFLDASAFPSLGIFNPASNVVVDMTAGTMTGGATNSGTFTTHAGAPLLVFTFSSFTLGTGLGITFTNTGYTAVAFLSRGDMTIDGTINANGSASPLGVIGGPGATNAGDGENGEGNSGGGGGGYGGTGGSGQRSLGFLDLGGPGGTTYNPDITAQLEGGSQGGSSGFSGSRGGGGGGALQLGTLGSISIAGTISVDGGAVAAGSGGQGGGSGGGLLVQANIVFVASNSVLTANGGDGGVGLSAEAGSGGPGGGGRIVVGFATSGINNGSITAAPGNATYAGGVGGPGTVVFARAPVPVLPGITALADMAGNLVMTWPVRATNYVIETSPTLDASALWTAAPGGVVVGDNFVLTNQTVGTAGFFRLVAQ
jgi:hypothetical protein